MKKFLSINYSNAAFNLAILLLRVTTGMLMITSHGYQKLVHFADIKGKFTNFFGIGSTLSLSLAIFAEFFCAIFLIIGLFSRLVVIPMIITMCIALFKTHNGDVFGKGEEEALYLSSFFTLLLCGPGKVSVDAMMR